MTMRKGAGGFYVNDEDTPQSDDLYDDCEPENRERYNLGMWEWGLSQGYSEEGLTQLYGPRPPRSVSVSPTLEQEVEKAPSPTETPIPPQTP